VLAIVIWLLSATPAPAPLPTLRYADVDVRYVRGAVSVVGVKLGRFDQPTALKRFRGRFEARVLGGKTVLDRVEFDFPLTAGAETDDADESSRKIGENFRRGVTAQTTVRVPVPDGADGLAIYDSVSKKLVAAPLKDSAPAAAAPAGVPRAR
jgi:hypothetical protein